MERKQKKTIDYDTHWKTIITNLFEDFILFFLPDAHKLIDFKIPVTFLEQELHKIIADKIKKGHVLNDKLVKVHLKNGSEKWFLIHIEVQSSFDSNFPDRMFTYFYRIYDKYDQKVTAIAIYTGSKNPKSYNTFNYEFLGTKVQYEFNSVKIDSFTENELLISDNPFAIAVLASKYLIQSKGDGQKRYSYKHKLIEIARKRNLKHDQIVSLLKFIYLILVLPEELELKFKNEITAKHIKSKDMKYEPIETDMKFSNQLHLALYGETYDERQERVIKEVSKKVSRKVSRKVSKKEKTSFIKKLFVETDWSDEKIADIADTTVEFVKEIRKDNHKI